MTTTEYLHAVEILGQPDEHFEVLRDTGESYSIFEFEETEAGATGTPKTLTITRDGVYRFRLRGASGIMGSNENTSTGLTYTGNGGKGACLTCDIPLAAGDELLIVVGKQGTISRAATTDGSGGGAGGGTWVFRKIASITDQRYQIAIAGQTGFWECLAVAAGGGGTQDLCYRKADADAADAGTSVYSLDSFVAASTKSRNPASSTNTNGVLSLSQIRSYGFIGAYYTRNSNPSYGGYGCGGVNDDAASAGGGWYGTSTVAQSWAINGGSAVVSEDNNDGGSAAILFFRELVRCAWWAPVVDRTLEDCVYGNPKGCLSAEVLTRIEADSDFLFWYALQLGYYTQDLYPMDSWDMTKYALWNKLENIRTNVRIVRSQGFLDIATPEPPALVVKAAVPHTTINDWEQVLLDTKLCIDGATKLMRICGTFYAGDSYTLQIIRR